MERYKRHSLRVLLLHCINYFFYRYIASNFNFWISQATSLEDLRLQTIVKERLKGN